MTAQERLGSRGCHPKSVRDSDCPVLIFAQEMTSQTQLLPILSLPVPCIAHPACALAFMAPTNPIVKRLHALYDPFGAAPSPGTVPAGSDSHPPPSIPLPLPSSSSLFPFLSLSASSRAPTHFLAVKLSSPALHASVAAIQEELIRMYGLSMEKVMVPPSKLHVTLAVLRLEEEEEEGEEGREERHGEEDVGRRTAGGREEERGAGGRIEGDSVHEPVRWKEEDREGADKGNDATPWSHVMAVCGETGRRLMSGKTALANASAASSSALSPSLTPSVSLPTVSQLQTFMSSFMVEMRRSLLNENGGKAPELNFVGLGSFGERVVFVRPCENGQGAQWMQRMVLRLREELFSNGWSVDRAPGSYKDVTLHGTIAKLSKFQKKKGRGRKTKGDMDPPLLGRDVWGMYDEMWASRGVIHNEVCERVQLLRMRGNADGYYECLAEWHFVAEDAKKEEEVDMIR